MSKIIIAEELAKKEQFTLEMQVQKERSEMKQEDDTVGHKRHISRDYIIDKLKDITPIKIVQNEKFFPHRHYLLKDKITAYVDGFQEIKNIRDQFNLGNSTKYASQHTSGSV